MGMSKEEFTRRFMADQAQKQSGTIEKPFTKWTHELTSDLYRFRGQGLSEEEIAERLGVDVKAVKNKIRNDKQRAKEAEKKRSRQAASAQVATPSVDERYIECLQEEFAKCKLALDEEREKNETLSAENEKLMFRAQVAEMTTPCQGAFEEIRSIADCIHAVDFEILDDFESIVMLVCRIMNVCDKEIKKGKSSAVAGTTTEPKSKI